MTAQGPLRQLSHHPRYAKCHGVAPLRVSDGRCQLVGEPLPQFQPPPLGRSRGNPVLEGCGNASPPIFNLHRSRYGPRSRARNTGDGRHRGIAVQPPISRVSRPRVAEAAETG